jgi:arylsulfatase A-like enzyme
MTGKTTRREAMAAIGAGTAALPMMRCTEPLEPLPDNRPNVILIMTDDQGYGDVGIQGNPHIQTPHLDKFATEGIRFDRFYCSPVCAPTRASLMTGRYYYRSGVVHTSRGGAKMHGEEVTIAQQLRDAGYQTGLFGKWHLGDTYPMRPQDQGFAETLWHKSGGIGQTPDKPNSYFSPQLWKNDEQVQSNGYCTDVFFDGALDFIDRHQHEPFFVYLPTNAPHGPLDVAPSYSDPYLDMGLNESTAKVYGMVANIDENVGRLLGRLEQLKLRENTLIIFMSDNGHAGNRYADGLRGGKSTAYEGGLRVPCFVQWPQGFSGGRHIEHIAAHIDWHPTLLDICGASSSAPPFDGKSIKSLLENPSADWPDRTLFFQCHRGLTPKRYQNCAVMTQQYKLLGYPGTFNDEQLDTSDNHVFELYDVQADAEEQHNLSDASPSVVAALRAEYDTWFDDVENTRHFEPGIIQIGSHEENPVRLCRYQDSQYVDGHPTVWQVMIEQAGDYECIMQESANGALYLNHNGRVMQQSVEAGDCHAVFELPAGRASLDIWFQGKGQARVVHTDNSTRGDVDIRLL